VTRRIYQLQPLPDELCGYRISLKAALTWQTHHSRLQQDASGVLQDAFRQFITGVVQYYVPDVEMVITGEKSFVN